MTLISGQFTNVESVSALGTPEIVSVNPPSGSQVGSNVCIRAKVAWDADFRSMRIRFGNEGWNESAEVEFERCFGTGHLSAGRYNIRVEVAKVNEDWSTATATETGYELTAPPAPQNPSCSVDSFDAWPRIAIVGEQVHISGSGSCNVGVRAIKVKVDGNDLYEIGAPNLSWTWNTSGITVGNHNLSLWVAGQGDNNWDYAAKSGNIIISVLSPNEPTSEPSFPFVTGNVIDINGNLFVIVVDGNSMERRHIPNPETLDALGIPRSWVDN